MSDIQNAVLFLDKFGMNNVSVSLVYGLPGQTVASWRQTLRKALDLEPYEVAVSPVSPADGEGLARKRQRALYEVAAELLSGRGLAEYAVGRFARAAGESAYVKALALGADLVGVGLGAASCVDGLAWRNTDDFNVYRVASDDAERVVRDVSQLDDEARAALAVRRGLCLAEGVEAEAVRPAACELAAWRPRGWSSAPPTAGGSRRKAASHGSGRAGRSDAFRGIRLRGAPPFSRRHVALPRPRASRTRRRASRTLTRC